MIKTKGVKKNKEESKVFLKRERVLSDIYTISRALMRLIKFPLTSSKKTALKVWLGKEGLMKKRTRLITSKAIISSIIGGKVYNKPQIRGSRIKYNQVCFFLFILSSV